MPCPSRALGTAAIGGAVVWLHTHAADGIVHGHVTVLVDGKVFTGNPRDVPLNKHSEIQLEVGTPLVAPESISWANTGL